uniref:Uncharacterized protein n=1 Tax=Siphoviridae sp. ctg2r17 TaxID=2825601 RepID=A0A8S5P088_9CAUD|nr:MAG TPA: hypothetical protein [Siphoviridae sp. ctg2r17]
MILSITTRSVDVATLSVVRINNFTGFGNCLDRAKVGISTSKRVHQSSSNSSHVEPWQPIKKWNQANQSKLFECFNIFHYKILSLVKKLYHGNEI